MAEPGPFPRPWHGASDRGDAPGVLALRAQRAEVDALMAHQHAPAGEARSLAWWRLHLARRARLILLGEDAHRLPPLPPPEDALSRWQKLRLRLGILRLETAQPPARIARLLRAGLAPYREQ